MNHKKLIDLNGETFGRWKVLKYSHRDEKRRHLWLCKCECGTTRPVLGHSLRQGGSQSCGCLVREINTALSTTHSLCRHPAYSSYRAMRNRCENPKTESYECYGGRGITFSPRWSRFEDFWADMGPTWMPGLSLERIDVNGNYEPGNVRWATSREQGANRRSNRIIDTPEGPMMLFEAAERSRIGYATLAARIRYGWAAKDLFLPISKGQSARRPKVIIDTPRGRMSVADASEAFNLPQQTIYSRIERGYAPEDFVKPANTVKPPHVGKPGPVPKAVKRAARPLQADLFGGVKPDAG